MVGFSCLLAVCAASNCRAVARGTRAGEGGGGQGGGKGARGERRRGRNEKGTNAAGGRVPLVFRRVDFFEKIAND